MNQKPSKDRSLISKKYYSMLLGGTLTMMVVSALLMSDSIIAGSVIGADAVAGITLVTPLYSLAAFFGAVFSLGVPIVYSTEMGKFNKKEADHVFGFGLLMSISISVLLFLVIILFGDSYLKSCTPPVTVLHEARGYLHWMRFTVLLLPLQMLIAAVVYNDGDETLSTAANLVQGIGNIAGSIILSKQMGIRGIGLASFLFNVVALGILSLHFLKKSNSLRINFYFSVKLLKTVVRYSIIDSGSYLFLAGLTAILNSFISGRFGSEYLITVSAIALCRELQIVFDGIGEAITPILSIYLGEENTPGIKLIYRLAKKTAVVEGIVVTAALAVSAPLIPKILSIKETHLTNCVIREIRIIAIGSVFISILYLLTSYYLLIEKISLGLIMSAFRDVIMPGILAVPLGIIFGLNGVFIGMATAPAATLLLLSIYTCIRYGRKNSPLLLSELNWRGEPYLFSLITEPVEIIALQKKVETLLVEKNFDKKAIGRAKLLIEELFMLIREKNDDKAVLCECSIILLPDMVRIIVKDDGNLFDISEDDVTVTSLTAFAVSAYMNNLGQDKRYLTTMSLNRSAFEIKKGTSANTN